MPFVSKDWRDPGEFWVKTDEGWEKKKILNCGASYESDDDSASFSQSDSENDSEKVVLLRRATNPDFSFINDVHWSSPNFPRRRLNSAFLIGQPHCHITLKCTREIAAFNGLSEALKRLDFRSAIWDVQRFHYICKLLDILITKKLTSLAGGAQRMLFAILEEVARQVSSSQQNLHILHKLLQKLQQHLKDYISLEVKIGSTVLWEQHLQRLQQINSIATNIEICTPSEDSHPTLQELPEECIREILRKLDNHTDITSAAEAYSVMAKVACEKSIWRDLCNFHWSKEQIECIICTHKQQQVKKEWQDIYHRLRKTYGLRENYLVSLMFCKNCRCLFWETLGHPCIAESNPDIKKRIQTSPEEAITRVPPKVFLSYFSL